MLTSSIAHRIAIVKNRVCFLKAPYYASSKYVIRTGLKPLKPVKLQVLYFHWVMWVIQPKQTLQNRGEGRNLWDVAETEEELHRSLVVVQPLFGLLSQQGLFAESDSSPHRKDARPAGTDLCQTARNLKGINKPGNNVFYKHPLYRLTYTKVLVLRWPEPAHCYLKMKSEHIYTH